MDYLIVREKQQNNLATGKVYSLENPVQIQKVNLDQKKKENVEKDLGKLIQKVITQSEYN